VSESGTNGAVLRVEGVRKSYGAVHALDGVDFGVSPGEVVALMPLGPPSSDSMSPYSDSP
jgi:ABC-type branched-subunit amino acid transport system ATPase component